MLTMNGSRSIAETSYLQIKELMISGARSYTQAEHIHVNKLELKVHPRFPLG